MAELIDHDTLCQMFANMIEDLVMDGIAFEAPTFQ
ncbi:hypothetical protein HAL1_06190 [Halomonas sp. HAL1]|nr:hypothetical protein HAL1_06190 [Halomonas sp. HAL1]